MPFLSRRSVDPLTPRSPLSRDTGYTQKLSNLPQTPRSRARSEASILRRVSTLFAVRRRTSKRFSQPSASPAGIEYKCSHPWSSLPRVSSDSTPQSSLEIRRPSGLGRRASLLGSDDSVCNSESFEKISGEELDAAPTGSVSLPNLYCGAFRLPEGLTYPSREPPRARRTKSFALPDSIFRVVLEFLARRDLAAVTVVSHGFCSAARYALYHSLDVRNLSEPSLQKLYQVLARREELAALVVSFSCPSRPSSHPLPLDDVRHALRNMLNLKSLTLASFTSILSYAHSLVFSLNHLTVLDRRMTRSQLVAMRDWLATQSSLESLSFPYLVECTDADPSFVDEWASVADPSHDDDHGPLSTILPELKSLRASTEIVSTLCSAMHNPIENLTLDVHATLYTGLRPSSVLRSLCGVRDMHIVFAPEVDKRTVEKFLGVTGGMLTGEDKAEAVKSLEVEVSWTDDDAAETLYGIVTSIISRFRGLETLKLTSPFRSFQAPVPTPVALSLTPPRPPAPVSSPPPSAAVGSLRGWIRREFVACGVEKDYARTWTKHCPSLSDIQFDFSCSATEADVELCGVWFRRKMPWSAT